MRRSLFVLLSLLALSACSAEESPPPAVATLGPADGRDLTPTDLERIQVGDVAPDFSLVSLAGPVVTLSEFRGSKNVLLVFYRGWW